MNNAGDLSLATPASPSDKPVLTGTRPEVCLQLCRPSDVTCGYCYCWRRPNNNFTEKIFLKGLDIKVIHEEAERGHPIAAEPVLDLVNKAS